VPGGYAIKSRAAEPLDKFALGPGEYHRLIEMVIHPNFPNWHYGIVLEIRTQTARHQFCCVFRRAGHVR
jgi:hypothetical protein